MDNRCLFATGENGVADARIPMSEVGSTVIDMSTALWNDLAPAPRPAGWGAATHVAAGLWRIADPRGIVVGHIRAVAADGDWRYAAERFHAASGRFRRLGEFWSSSDALECLRYAR
ncbi:hypothetical protein QE410_001659 [Microbacterium sp. SORGH_AS 1204]|nr:hypothetical protein [Microbacterium sp. SORGH_AS_1204]